MLPPEFLVEVAVAVCKGGLGGFNPGALVALADLTDLQILEFLCKPTNGAESSGLAEAAPPSEVIIGSARGPVTESEEFAQFADIGTLLMRGGRCKFTADEMQKYWESRRERAAAKAD